MFRLPVSRGQIRNTVPIRLKSSSSYIRSTFINYFKNNHEHKYIKSSAVVPLCDPTVPFVNAGMNQFKGVFLGNIEAPCPRAVNSQKCVRIGGKHNDLDVVGMDGTHHTFFEMLGNWSFGDYYKKEACQMAWDLLLGPYRLKVENLLVTYFAGDAIIGLQEDRECRDIWKQIGVPSSHLKACNAKDNFWEMGVTGPCGPCTEIHYIHPDGELTEIWNLVFIQCNRKSDGSVTSLRRHHVDTGMGLERMAAIMQGVNSNYDTDLFRPIITSIEKNSKGASPYASNYSSDAILDQAYRRLSDHARMISICLADGVYPSSSLNLKQIMRKCFKISTDVFQNPNLLSQLYNEVIITLGEAYPELVVKEKDAKLIIDYEKENYAKLRASLSKKWKDLAKMYPEVEALNDIDSAGFTLGYKEFKETMSKVKSTTIPGELVFKLYDTHGFQEDVIERIANLNNLEIDRKGFWKLLSNHKSRHKTAFKEQASNKGIMFDKTIETLYKNNIKMTYDHHKYNYAVNEDEIILKPLKTKVVAILDENGEWIDYSEPAENKPYYIITESTNFYCEEGGQTADDGHMVFNSSIQFKIDSVFKIRDIVFHRGHFVLKNSDCLYIKNDNSVQLIVNSEKRLATMRNHSAVHLLNAALRKVLPNSVICQTGSSVTEKGLSLNLSVYGQKLSQNVVLDAQELIRECIKSNATIDTRVLDMSQISLESDVLTVPGEIYPETGLRLVTCMSPLVSKELCCGTHVPSTGYIGEVCVTRVRGAGGHAPALHALAGDAARQARELFCRTQKLSEVVELADPERVREEVTAIKEELSALCSVGGGAPYGEYAECLQLLDTLRKRACNKNDVALQALADAEVEEACSSSLSEGRRFTVHFVRSSYLLCAAAARRCVAALNSEPRAPALLLGCAGGTVVAAAHVPKDMVTATFTAEKWLSCVLPIFKASLLPAAESSLLTRAEMSDTKVSLITCEQLVQDAMRVAIKYAQAQMPCDAPRRRSAAD